MERDEKEEVFLSKLDADGTGGCFVYRFDRISDVESKGRTGNNSGVDAGTTGNER